jgi:hypothetical protein
MVPVHGSPPSQIILTLGLEPDGRLLKYHREVRSLPHEPLHWAARYLIVDEAPFQKHYPKLWFSKALYAPTIVVRSTILAALGLYRDTFDESGSVCN